jgi:hypothetical protein
VTPGVSVRRGPSEAVSSRGAQVQMRKQLLKATQMVRFSRASQDDTRGDPGPSTLPRSLRDRASPAGKSAGANARNAGGALVEAVGRLADKAIDRVLLTDERITSAADGKRLPAGDADVEALAGHIQRMRCSTCLSSADSLAVTA